MISVPEAALLPKYPRPVRRAKSSSRDGGKPCGYVRNGRSSITPQISQCPVVESFPCDLGSATPCAAVGLTPGAREGLDHRALGDLRSDTRAAVSHVPA